ncbi:MAG: hypothetical protein M1817_002065 [Caeruleum heppii]|nr:MAG: hypothetical protein M1817_002065 [Caeruleum heppii]
MSSAGASEPSPSPSGRLKAFPKTLRKKAPTSSRNSSIVDEESGESHGIRSSIDSAVEKIKQKTSVDPPPGQEDPGLVQSLLLKRKARKHRKRAARDAQQFGGEEAERGRSIGERGTLEEDVSPRTQSLRQNSTGSNQSDLSRITYDSDEDSAAVAPPLTTRPSHAGYLTLSSPLLQQSQPDLTAPANLDADHRTNSLPVHASAPVTGSSSGSLAHASTFHSTSAAASNASSEKIDRPTSPISKFKEVFAPTPRKDPDNQTSPDRASTGSGSSGGLKGLLGRKAEDGALGKLGSLASRRVSKPGDLPSPRVTPIVPAIKTTSSTSSSLTTPVTTVTPPTPTDPEAKSPASPSSSLAGKASDEGPTKPEPMLAHRRLKSSTSSNAPSKLSNAVSAPLTPTIEEPPGSTPSTSERPGSQGGFFSSVITAAQNAATTFGNTISNNPLAPGTRSRSGTQESSQEQPAAGGEEVEARFGNATGDPASANGPTAVPKPLAVETLGSGDLSLSHLGFSPDASPVAGEANMSSKTIGNAMSTSDQRLASDRVDPDMRNPSPLRDNASVASARTGSAGDDGSRKASRARAASEIPHANGSIGLGSTPIAEDVVPGPARSIREPSLAGDQTPPSHREWDKESVIQRSGSVRSRTGTARRKRGSSAATGTTIAAAIGASNAALSNPAANGSAPRLTGFAVASKKRNKDFHQLFRSVPEDDYLIEDYSAAIQKDILLHGRFYVSEGHICFYSNILGYITTLVINFDEMVSIEKKNTAMFIPNALVIQTLHAKNTFASFASRDSTYDLLIGIWKISHPNLKSSLNGVELDEAGNSDKTVKHDGPTSEDESDEESDEDEDVYDEDEEEEEAGGSFVEAGEGSVAGSELGEVGAKSVTRKPSALMGASNGTTNGAGPAADAKGAAAATAAGGDFPGPSTHAPSQCGDQDSHYDKVIADEVVPAPLGKVHALLFGPASVAFMTKFLTENQKVTELQLDEDKKGLSDEKKSRESSYIKPLNGSIGPKQTKCLITETLDAMNLEKAVSVTITTQTPDVPSGNAFSVKTRYCLMWAEGNATRLLINCTIEWTGKSWLKGPIEKGANDGQVSYATELVAAIKGAISSKSRTGAGGATKGKGGKRRKKDAGETAVKSHAHGAQAVKSQKKEEHWGLLEPLRGPLGPVADMISPLVSSTTIIAILFFLLIHTSVRLYRLPSSAPRASSSPSFPGHGPSAPERLAAYDQIWRQSESELWDWLDERIGMTELPLSTVGGGLGADAQRDVKRQRDLRRRLQNEQMSEREVEEAIRVTQEKLDVLKGVVGSRAEEKGQGRAEGREDDGPGVAGR